VNAQRTGTNPVKVEAEPRTLLRLRRMGREIRMTDQMLSLDLDSVQIVEGGPAPAWTSPDGSTISVNVKRMPTVWTREGIAVWLGTNAHELFHNLYTPRDSALLMRRLKAAEQSQYTGIFRAWNILEDQRIERLGLARYAAWRGYLIAALSHHIPYDDDGSWVLLAGRTWLPAEVRSISRARFVATNDERSAQLAASLIGAYQRLADPGEADADEAWHIVEQFWDAFGSKVPQRGACGSSPISEGEPEPGDDGETEAYYPAADESDPDEPDDEGDEPDEGEPDTAEPDEGDDDGDEPDEGDDDDGDEGKGGDTDADDDDGSDESGDDGDDEADGDDEGDGESDTDGESDDGDGWEGDGVSKDGDGTRSMDDAMKDAVDDALSDGDTADDLDRVVDQVDHGMPGAGDLPRTTGAYTDVTDAARSLARGVSDVLVDIKDDNEAAWIRRTDTGRFNVGRWATDPDWDADNVFDEFQAGAMDASSLDVVLVLDVSGSMSGQNFALAEATWAIRTAVDRVEGSCTVLGFGDGASLMFDTHHRPDGRLFLPHLESSTNPTPACREAHRVVTGSPAANKLVIVLTDGQWWDVSTAQQALTACKAEGATTCIIGLGPQASNVVPGFCKVDVVARIRDSAELVPIFRDLAERSMLAAARR
jgi:hypothetical protein